MNELAAVERRSTLDSREVAEMVGKRHDHLLRDIQGYCEILAESDVPNFGVVDFFIESTYKDAEGRIPEMA